MLTCTILISPCAARGTYIHLRMNPKFWLATMFLMSRIGVLDANSRCHVTESSIGGMYLRGHVFKVHRDELPESVFSCVMKKSRVRVTMSSLVKTSVNWTIVQRKQDRKILYRIKGDFTWSVLETEVPLTFPRLPFVFAFLGRLTFLIFLSRLQKTQISEKQRL